MKRDESGVRCPSCRSTTMLQVEFSPNVRVVECTDCRIAFEVR